MGQLFMMGFDGPSVNPQIRSLIENYHVGSILLSAKNLKCIHSPSVDFSRFTLSRPFLFYLSIYKHTTNQWNSRRRGNEIGP